MWSLSCQYVHIRGHEQPGSAAASSCHLVGMWWCPNGTYGGSTSDQDLCSAPIGTPASRAAAGVTSPAAASSPATAAVQAGSSQFRWQTATCLLQQRQEKTCECRTSDSRIGRCRQQGSGVAHTGRQGSLPPLQQVHHRTILRSAAT